MIQAGSLKVCEWVHGEWYRALGSILSSVVASPTCHVSLCQMLFGETKE